MYQTSISMHWAETLNFYIAYLGEYTLWDLICTASPRTELARSPFSGWVCSWQALCLYKTGLAQLNAVDLTHPNHFSNVAPGSFMFFTCWKAWNEEVKVLNRSQIQTWRWPPLYIGSIQFVAQYDTSGPSHTGEFHSIQNKDCSLLSLVRDFAVVVFVSVMAYTETNTLSIWDSTQGVYAQSNNSIRWGRW